VEGPAEPEEEEGDGSSKSRYLTDEDPQFRTRIFMSAPGSP
jgi:hypothetical protein